MRVLIPLLLCGALVSCGGEAGHDEHDGHDHAAHEGPEEHAAAHGGTLVELSGHAGHVEALHDAQAGTLTIWVSDAGMAALALDEAPVLNFVAAGGPAQVIGVKSGEAWTFTHDGLRGEPGNARLRVKAGGTTYTPELAHEHG